MRVCYFATVDSSSPTSRAPTAPTSTAARSLRRPSFARATRSTSATSFFASSCQLKQERKPRLERRARECRWSRVRGRSMCKVPPRLVPPQCNQLRCNLLLRCSLPIALQRWDHSRPRRWDNKVVRCPPERRHSGQARWHHRNGSTLTRMNVLHSAAFPFPQRLRPSPPQAPPGSPRRGQE